MTLTAKHFVKVAGRLYTPGELIEEDLPQVSIDHLLSKGAVTVEEPAKEPEVEFIPAEEVDDIPDPKEIDAAEGIVKPKKRTTRKKG